MAEFARRGFFGSSVYLLWLIEAVVYIGIAWLCLPAAMGALALPLGLILLSGCRASRNLWISVLFAVPCALALTALRWLREYEEQFGTPTNDSYGALFQSNLPELSEYFISVSSLWPLTLFVAFFSYFCAFTRWHGRKAYSVSGRRNELCLCAALLALALGIGAAVKDPLVERVAALNSAVKNFQKLATEQRKLADQLLAAPVQAASPPLAPAQFEGTVIFVIGESTTRRHMSLYGYYRDTTPNLERRGNDLLVQKDTISPHSHTVPALLDLFTGADSDEGAPYLDNIRHNLISMLKSSGYKTYWFSNQNQYGLWENPISVLGGLADEKVFISKAFGKRVVSNSYDHALTPLIERALAAETSRKFIFVHFQATHIKYCSHIPHHFRKIINQQELGAKFFGMAPDRSANVNCYDNAIRYVDAVLDEIFTLASRQTRPAIVFYLADHGENPADGSSHNSSRHSAYHVEVPHIWYFNDAAKALYSDKLASFRKHAELPYKSSRQMDTILDLIGADDTLYDASRSLFSEAYMPPARRRTLSSTDFGNMNPYFSTKYVDYDWLESDDKKDYLEITRLNLQAVRKQSEAAYSKLWAHRMNSLGALGEAAPMFAGVELDLVYDMESEQFNVHHPPASSTGLTLENYLAALRAYPSLKLWLDWKNAEPENFSSALAALKRLDEKFGLKERAVIETGTESVFTELRSISANGFSHIYYSPAIPKKCNRSPYKKACLALADDIVQNASAVGASHISFNVRAVDFIRAHRRSFSKFQWAAWSQAHSTHVKNFINALPELDDLAIMLVKFPTIFRY